jgi:hypothetical protein
MTDEKSSVDVDAFASELGPELDFLADGLAPAVTDMARKIAAATVAETVQPLIDQANGHTAREREKHTTATMEAFGERHADWQAHEPAMLALAQKIQPNGMTELEFLEHLYATVTRDVREKEHEAAAAAADVETEIEQNARPHQATFADAYAAAKRGVRWEEPAADDAGAEVSPLRAAYRAAKRRVG